MLKCYLVKFIEDGDMYSRQAPWAVAVIAPNEERAKQLALKNCPDSYDGELEVTEIDMSEEQTILVDASE